MCLRHPESGSKQKLLAAGEAQSPGKSTKDANPEDRFDYPIPEVTKTVTNHDSCIKTKD